MNIDEKVQNNLIGQDDFKEIRNQNQTYVDKTLLIKKVLESNTKATLITRPSKFGKSVNLSMLDAFFNIKYKGNNWFDGLKISEHPNIMNVMNTYPVVYVNLNNLPNKDVEEFYNKMRSISAKLYTEHRYLETSEKVDPYFKRIYKDAVNKTLNKIDLTDSIQSLTEMLHQHHGVKSIVLIDGYDTFFHNSDDDKYRKKASEFINGMMSSALKNNESLNFAIVTGIMHIFENSTFPILDNLKINTVFSKEFDEYFGFTENEMKQLCDKSESFEIH